LIFNADESILKDSGTLMGPKLDKIALINKRLVRCLSNSLENLGKISQIIDIMGFSWSRKKLFGCLNLSIELNGRTNDVILQVCDGFRQCLRQIGKIPLQNVVKDLYKRLSIKWFHVDQIIMPNISHCDDVTTTDWR
jgi:hypothetical protein